jgi:hypothetical protein
MNKFIFVALSLFVSAVSVFGQAALEKDLKKSFRNYDVIKLDSKAVLEKARTKQPVEVQAYGRYFQFVLTPNDLRAKNYRAVESSDAGDRELKRDEVTTYKGKLTGDYASEVRFSVSEGNVEGLIYTGDNQKFFIAKADKFSKNAAKSDAVVYSENDLIKTVDLSDDAKLLPADVEGKVDLGLDILKSDAFSSAAVPKTEQALAADLRELEIATEADYQWVTQAGGAAVANTEILSILNLIDGIYRRDLNLTIKVTYQHAWSAPDSFASNTTSDLLNSFLSYWNANYPVSQYPRDVAHLFTGKFTNQGIAYTGVICRSPNYAYGLTGRSGTINHLLTAHEIGHNLGAEHLESSGACAGSIMNPLISFSAASFCDASKTQVNAYTTSYNGCLSLAGSTTSTPPAPTCSYSISPGSQSFSSFGGTGSVAVSTQSGCSWSAAANQTFVGITSGSGGGGSGTVFYSVGQNTSANPRSATISIAGQQFTIQQNGAQVSIAAAKTRFDFDGDGKADVSVFRPAAGSWYVSRSSNNSFSGNAFGQSGDLISPADFDGDGVTDPAVFRPANGTWYLQRSSAGFAGIQFGQSGDIPVSGDFDGDGKADVSVFRPNNGVWYRLNSSTGQFVGVQFGQNGDIPVIGDFDGDLKSDITVFRPSNGVWYILRSSNGTFYGVGFGQSGDVPTAADFDGDKKTDIAVYRPSAGSWYRLNSSTGSFFAQQFGTAEDKPAAADFDGDGRADLAVFRPSTGSWYLQRTTAGYTGQQFGTREDIPTSAIILP